MNKEHFEIIKNVTELHTKKQQGIYIRLDNPTRGAVKFNVFVDDRWFMTAQTIKEQETYDILVVDVLPRASTINVSTVTNILTNVVLDTTKIIRQEIREFGTKNVELSTQLELFEEEF